MECHGQKKLVGSSQNNEAGGAEVCVDLSVAEECVSACVLFDSALELEEQRGCDIDALPGGIVDDYCFAGDTA